MFFIVHEDPSFVVDKDITLFTSEGALDLDEGDCISLNKTTDERLFLGVAYDEDSDVLEISTQTTARDLLENCVPATFEIGLDEDGDETIKTVLAETKSTITEKIDRITLTEDIPSQTILVTKIR